MARVGRGEYSRSRPSMRAAAQPSGASRITAAPSDDVDPSRILLVFAARQRVDGRALRDVHVELGKDAGHRSARRGRRHHPGRLSRGTAPRGGASSAATAGGNQHDDAAVRTSRAGIRRDAVGSGWIRNLHMERRIGIASGRRPAERVVRLVVGHAGRGGYVDVHDSRERRDGRGELRGRDLHGHDCAVAGDARGDRDDDTSGLLQAVELFRGSVGHGWQGAIHVVPGLGIVAAGADAECRDRRDRRNADQAWDLVVHGAGHRRRGARHVRHQGVVDSDSAAAIRNGARLTDRRTGRRRVRERRRWRICKRCLRAERCQVPRRSSPGERT